MDMTNAYVLIADRGEIVGRPQLCATADAIPCTGTSDQNKSR
jgi:hypothetical protein